MNLRREVYHSKSQELVSDGIPRKFPALGAITDSSMTDNVQGSCVLGLFGNHNPSVTHY
jgi:hypothetical protein